MKRYLTWIFLMMLMVGTGCTGKEETGYFPTDDYLIINTNSVSFKGEGETKTFSFTCTGDWQVSGCPDWLTPSSTSGKGNSVQLTAMANPSVDNERTGSFQLSSGIVSRTISISQSAAAVELAVNVSDVSFTSDGGSSAFTITSNTSWEIFGSADWFSLSTTSGTGNKEIAVTVPSTTSENDHEATLTIMASDEQTTKVTVRQTGLVVSLSLSITSLNVVATASQVDLGVITNAPSWSVSSDCEWCTSDALTGSNNATLHLKLHDNTTTQPRQATVTVSTSLKSAKCTITQEAGTLPELTVPVVTTKSKYSVLLSATYTSMFTVTEYGFVYSATNEQPTISDGKASVAGSELSGTMAVLLNELQPGTSYYVRSFATSAVGTSYSETLTVTTDGSLPGDDDNPPIQM